MLTIQFLGGFKISNQGELLPGLTKPRGQSLFAYLLLNQAAPLARNHIAYAFWPNSTDKQARTNLRRELHQLRQTWHLIDDHLQGNTQTVHWQMPPNTRVDAVEFTSLIDQANQTPDVASRKTTLQNAIDLYQGDLLPGLYDDWLLAKREALRQSFIRALESLTELTIADREYPKAISLLQRLLQVDPLYEAGYAQLMELYACQNDRARALHTYHTCATLLERELDVPPSAEIEAIYQRYAS